MSKLTFKKSESPQYLAEVLYDDGNIGMIREYKGKYFYVGYADDCWLTRKNVARIAKYMKSLRTADLPKTEADDSGPVVTGTLKVEKPHTMTPDSVAKEPKVAAFTTEPDGKVTITYDVKQPGTVTQYATATSSRMVMPGTASIRFVIEGRDYTLDITGVIVGENASVELRQENDAWSL